MFVKTFNTSIIKSQIMGPLGTLQCAHQAIGSASINEFSSDWLTYHALYSASLRNQPYREAWKDFRFIIVLMDADLLVPWECITSFRYHTINLETGSFLVFSYIAVPDEIYDILLFQPNTNCGTLSHFSIYIGI